jgi:hypothetical protein
MFDVMRALSTVKVIDVSLLHIIIAALGWLVVALGRRLAK